MNKTESRVELLWNPAESDCLSGEQKERVGRRLASRITDGGLLIIASERHRSQIRNREEVTERFLQLITGSLVPERKRIPTRPTRSSIEKRLKGKRIRREIKRSRRIRPDES